MQASWGEQRRLARETGEEVTLTVRWRCKSCKEASPDFPELQGCANKSYEAWLSMGKKILLRPTLSTPVITLWDTVLSLGLFSGEKKSCISCMERRMSIHSRDSHRCSPPSRLPPTVSPQTPTTGGVKNTSWRRGRQHRTWSQTGDLRIHAFVNSSFGVRNGSWFRNKCVLSQHCY